MTLNRWDPFRDLLNFHEKMNRVAHQAFDECGLGRAGTWGPKVDVLETPEAFIFRADLPGVGRDQINIEISGNQLVISGERGLEEEPPIAAYHNVERETGCFRRTFKLPSDVDVNGASATYVDGVLQLVLPKTRESVEAGVTVVCLG